jgi:hypothetical protein
MGWTRKVEGVRSRVLDRMGFSILESFPGDLVAGGVEPLAVSPHLTVECKTWNEISAVILSRDLPAITYYDFSGQIYNFPWLIERKLPTLHVEKDFHLGWFLTNINLHYRAFLKRIGPGMGMKPGDTSDKSGREFRTGIMQLIKAQSYDVAIAIARDKTIRHSHYPFYFGFLALVVDARIFEVRRNGADLEINEIPHGIAKASYKPSYSGEILNYLVDIVQKKHFSSYLDIIGEDFSAISASIMKDKERLARHFLRPKPA